MRIEGSISPISGGTGFSREDWCQLVSRRPEFRRFPDRLIGNPFGGGSTVVKPSPDAAEVVMEGRTVGEVYWSMSEEPMVNVIIEPSALSLVEEWATDLGGEFRPDSPEPSI